MGDPIFRKDPQPTDYLSDVFDNVFLLQIFMGIKEVL